MRTVLVIGIGAGDPEHVTVQAIRAINRADVVFVIEKDDRTEELVRLRRQWEQAIAAQDGCCAFLVWGDPAIYDSTLAVLDEIRARGNVEFDHEVIPGISSLQALAARHRVPFNRVGGAVQITTGRQLARGFPAEADDVLVMLDSDCTFAGLDGDVDIYWGAYVGTPDEILVAGRVADVADEIRRVRREARERKGWVMDSYLLRRPLSPR